MSVSVKSNNNHRKDDSLPGSKSYLLLLCLSGFLDLFGVSLVIPFLPKHLRGLGESYTAVGIVSSLYGLLQFFSAPIVGNLSDRFGRKRLLIASLCCTAVSYLAMTDSSLSGSLLIIALSRVPPGLLKHSQSLTKAEIAQSTRALSYFNAASTAGFIVGPPLTGFLMDRYATVAGYSMAGKIAAASFLLNALLVYYLVSNERSDNAPKSPKTYQNGAANGHKGAKHTNHGEAKPHEEEKTLWQSVTGSFSSMASSCALLMVPPLSYIYMAKLLNSMALFMERSTHMLYLESELKLSSSALGWLSSIGPLLTVVMAPLVTPACALFAKDSPRLQAICCLLEILSVVIVMMAPNAFFVALSALPHGLSTAIGRVNFTSMSLHFGGRGSVGTLIGFDQSVLSLSRTFSPALAGLLMDVSLRLPLYLSVCLLIPTALLYNSLCNFNQNSPSPKKID